MRALTLLALTGAACSTENTLNKRSSQYGEGDGAITGRVCDESRYVWLEGATVYTHIIDTDGELRDTRQAITDADGAWTLDDLADGTYTVYVQYGSTTVDTFNARVKNGKTTEVPEPDCTGSADVQVAVVTGDFDDFEAVLTTVGVGGYKVVDGQTGDEMVDFLTDAEELALYDAIFFAGGHLEDHVFYTSDGDAVQQVASVTESLKDYVSGGGIVFASDWSYDVIEQVWPGQIEFYGEDSEPDAAQVGEPATITASITNDDLESEVGKDQVKITFDLDTWPVAVKAGDGAKVWLKGDAGWREGQETGTAEGSPLLVQFESGDGEVVFTPWRMSANLEGNSLSVVKWLLGREL
jgi:hypothetical protein